MTASEALDYEVAKKRLARYNFNLELRLDKGSFFEVTLKDKSSDFLERFKTLQNLVDFSLGLVAAETADKKSKEGQAEQLKVVEHN